MSAKVIELPARTRGDRAARELREGVIGVLKEIHQPAWRRCRLPSAARDLVPSMAAVVAYFEGVSAWMCSIWSTTRPKLERPSTPPQML